MFYELHNDPLCLKCVCVCVFVYLTWLHYGFFCCFILDLKISVVFNLYKWKLLIFTKHSCELLMPLSHHRLSFHTSLLDVKQEDISLILIHMSFVPFSSIMLDKRYIVGQKRTMMALIFALFLNFTGNPPSTIQILLLQGQNPFCL